VSSTRPGGSFEVLERAFPFLFVVGEDLRLTFVSSRISGLVSAVKPGAMLSDHFRAVRPESPLTLEDLRSLEGAVVILELRAHDQIRLRGEFFGGSGDEAIYFLGHPWVTDLKELEPAGLNLSDFPAHAGLTDMLVLIQTMKSGYAEARSLALQLQDTSLALEERNAELEDELALTKQLEETVLQSQKMEAIGQLAAGVAHDFNNILLAINGHAGLVAGNRDSERATVVHMENILEACRRAAQLTARLLAFGRRKVMEPTQVDIAQSLKEVERMLQPLLGEQVRLAVDHAPDLGTVVIDPSAMQQILTNLALNARDSFVSGGTIKIHASREVVSEGRLLHSGQQLSPGSWIVIEVFDDGSGMTEEVRGRIFEPYFTTKSPGSGTGLGLSTVWWIIDRCNGAIEVESSVDTGTCFRVHLPTSEGTAPPPVHSNSNVEPTSIRTKGGDVLLVEDEAIVRKPIAQMLKRLGWTVTAVGSAEEALALAEERRVPFDLVLTDLVMPGMGGRELAAVLRRRGRDLTIVFMTGYDPETAGGMVTDGELVLPKPFNLQGLSNILAQACGE